MRRVIPTAVIAAAALAVAAAPTYAAPSDTSNASCVAQYTTGPPGPPGQFQSQAHVSQFGTEVSGVAHQDRDYCYGG